MQRLIDEFHHFQREAFGNSRKLFKQGSRNGRQPPALPITCADAGLLAERVTQNHSHEFYFTSGLGTFIPPASAATEHESDSIAVTIEYAVRGAAGVWRSTLMAGSSKPPAESSSHTTRPTDSLRG